MHKIKKWQAKTGADKLCDFYSGYGALQCYYLTGGCPGSIDNRCWPNHVWMDSGSQFSFNSGAFGPTGGNTTHAFSVRCVLDLKMQTSSVSSKPAMAPCGAIN